MEEFDIETEPLMPIADRSSDNDTPTHQAQPLLGTTHRENLQLQNRNRPEDIADVLGMNAFQGYVNTPLQTLDGIVVQQPKRFLPLAEEAKHLAEEIHIEKLNEQWAGIPHKKLLNQSFHDQLNSLQILENLALLESSSKTTPSSRYCKVLFLIYARYFLLFLSVMHNTLCCVGEHCEMVCEFFVRVLCSSRVILVM